MKIAVMGYSGAGKSTLAKKLSQKLGCPLLHLDKVNFAPGWKERDRVQCQAEVRRFLENPSWVIDGNYGNFEMERRLEEADRVILLLFPRRICLIRALTRYLAFRHQVRDSAAEGCEEKFDLEFFLWLIRGGRAKAFRQRYDRIRRQYAAKVTVCSTPAEVRALEREI